MVYVSLDIEYLYCFDHDDNSNNESDCEHTRAVVEFIKRRQGLEKQNTEFEEYTGDWVSHFDITKKNKVVGNFQEANNQDHGE
jgi:hypothetical protein